jgi:predicted metalloprotease
MLWKGRQGSSNIEDLRGIGGKGLALGGGGCGTVIVIVLALLFGVDPQRLLNQMPGQEQAPTQTQQGRPGATTGQDDEMKQFISVVLADTETVWSDILPKQAGVRYRKPTLSLFTGSVSSACGRASSAVGPFYCPGDEKIYIDFSFYRELKTQFKAPGDFAQAYVLAHEVGHHIQNVTGMSDKVTAAQQRARSEAQSNQLSVALELQADCYAGVFAFYEQNKGYLEAGDIQEALTAASAVGDDNIQKMSQGYVVPDSFTHGSSQQRASWFQRGFQAGDMRQCNTFGTNGGGRGGGF